MAKTIALPEELYSELLEVKRESGAETFAEVVEMLLSIYRRHRVEELKKAIERLKLSNEEVEKVEEVVREARGRSWW